MQNCGGKAENAVEFELPEGCARGFVWIEICVHHNGKSSKPNCVEVWKFKLEYLVGLEMATVWWRACHFSTEDCLDEVQM